MNLKLKLALLSILSGLLLWGAWPMSPAFPLVFVAWVPLLFVEQLISENYQKTGRKVFLYSLFMFLTWNSAVTWWVCRASLEGGVFAIIGNSLLMTIPFILFHHTKKTIGERIGLLSLIAFWIGFEYVHLNWELTWSWLTLGNVFANTPSVIQWYEYTGALGGSLWILLLNTAIFTAIKNYSRMKWRAVMRPVFLLVFPLAVSYSLIDVEIVENDRIEVVVVQPNIDSYTEKFRFNARTGEENNETFMSHKEQLRILIEESKKLITPNTRYLFWPETSVPGGYWERSLDAASRIRELQSFVKEYHHLTLITGIDTYKSYDSESSSSSSARFRQDLGYYDVFNSAMQVNEKGQLSVYHKSKLVPGVERMPYPGLFGFLEYFAIDLGGISGSLGAQNTRDVFFNEKGVGVAPAICYESIFGEYIGDWINNGAQLIAVVTNDNWWDDTQGYKQHFAYSRLRAIEHRKYVARAANTGISGFINPDGSLGKTLSYCKRGGVRGDVQLNNIKTYYTLHGDYIGRIAGFIAIAFLLSVIVKRLMSKKK